MGLTGIKFLEQTNQPTKRLNKRSILSTRFQPQNIFQIVGLERQRCLRFRNIIYTTHRHIYMTTIYCLNFQFLKEQCLRNRNLADIPEYHKHKRIIVIGIK